MKTTALVLALSWLTPAVDRLWNAPLDNGNTVLGQVLHNCRESGVIDAICCITDAQSIIAGRHALEERVAECPEFYHGHPFNLLNIELQNLYREHDLSLAVEILGDLTFIVPWNMPLLDARMLERMYHALLDDPVTARIVPMQPVDPHLYTKTPDGGFFPVWEHRGVDRQDFPQLYQPAPAALTSWTRLFRCLPKITGLPADARACFSLDEAHQLDLLRFLSAYRHRDAPTPG